MDSNKIKGIIKCISVFTMIALCQTISAQDNSKQAFPSVVPPSPDAAALGKYGEIPVGTYTGIPQISIPLYQIQSRKLSLPISLSYHAGGVKVEDIASNVGLSWTLNAGGAITRSVRGRPDESPDGFFNNSLPADMAFLSNDDLKLIAENKRDAEPDEFYFNFGNYSGKLIFTKDGTCYSIPHNKFRIVPGIVPANGGAVPWEITAEDGTKYIFGTTETSTTQSACSSGGGFSSQSFNQLSYVSTWYLTRIQAPQADEYITFSYLPTSFQMDVKGSSSHYITQEAGEIQPNYANYCGTTVSISGKFINRIDFPGGKVDFTSASRLDLSGLFRITSMIVSNYNGQQVKKYLFDNDQYFESGCSTALCKRLKLEAVTEVGRNSSQLPPHLFEYNMEALPARNSNDTDHWGYYNKRNNTLSYPEFIDYFNEQTTIDYLPGANKKPDIDAVKAGTLTKIIYPTGGYTSFEYELNEVVSIALPNKTLAKTKKRIDGTNSSPTQQSTSFTIQGYFQNGLYVKVRYQTVGCSTSAIPSLEANCPYVQILGVNGTTYTTTFQSGLLRETIIFLPNGQYKLNGTGARFGQSYFLEVEYEPELNSPNKFAGGLRLRRISDSDGINASINIRKFIYDDNSGASTGRISNYPKYHYTNSYFFNQGGGFGCNFVEIPCFVRTSDSNTSLGTTRGGYVGYGKITELRGELGENGKTEYFYTSVWKSEIDNNSNFIDSYVYTLPYGPPQIDNEWLRGYLLNKIDYRYHSGNYFRLREVVNGYQPLGTGLEIRGTKVGIYKPENPCIAGSQPDYRTSLLRRYGNLSFVSQYTIEKAYNSDGITFAETRTDLTYGVSHRQLIESIKTFDSNVTSLWKQTVKYKYPEDYTITAPSDNMSIALNAMKTTGHIHNAVIEKQVWEQRNGLNRLIDADINLYKSNGYESDKQLKLLATDPINTYTPSFVNGTGNFVYENSKFKTQVSYDLFDTPTGNLLEATGIDGMKRSYLWANQKLYPIAEVINAANNSISYTSFEENLVGNWTLQAGVPTLSGDGASGSSYYIGQIETTNALPADSYIVSFWAKGNGNVTVNNLNIAINNSGWLPFSIKVNLAAPGKIYVNSNGLAIDELRLYPAIAQAKTFTYLPLVGMTSSTNSSNLPQNYKYDDFNRLQQITDYQGKIVKRNAYNIKGYSGSPIGSTLNAMFTTSGTKTVGYSLTFTALNTAPGVQYNWDFGDGSVASGAGTVSHIFNGGGIYTVFLTVTKGTDSNSSSTLVEINLPLTTDPNWPGPTITVNSASSSLFPSPGNVSINVTAVPAAGGTSPYTQYRWKVYDANGNKIIPILIGEEYEEVTTSSTATLTTAQFKFGPFTVKCRVVDSNNNASLVGVKATN
jgi:YD repeat-containing protein